MHSADVVNTGFTQDETSNVVVQVVYDEFAPLDDYEGVDITRLTRELSTKSSFGLNLMHISVDGEPIDDPDRSSSDVQRCTDVALEKADIQFQFDNLSSRPRLSVAASPLPWRSTRSGQHFSSATRCASARTPTIGLSSSVRKCGYSRPGSRSRMRRSPSSRSIPAASPNGSRSCRESAGSGRALKYILRAYGKNGQFDDTRPQSLSMTIREGSDLEGMPAELVAKREAAAPPSEGGPLAGTHESQPTPDNEVTTDVESAAAAPDQEAAEAAAPAPEEVRTAANDGPSVTTDAGGAEATAQAEDTTAEDTPPLSEDEDAASMSEEEAPAANDGESDANAEADSQDANAKQKPVPPLPQGELLAGYGESSLAVQNIRLGSGTVKVHGSHIPPEHTVWVAGRQVPVDAERQLRCRGHPPGGPAHGRSGGAR